MRSMAQQTPLLHALFSFFGAPGQEDMSNPRLNFCEYTLFVSHFLTLSERALAEFLFTLMTCTKEDRVAAASVLTESLESSMRALLSSSDSHKIATFLSKMSAKEHGKLYTNRQKFVDAVTSHNKSIVFALVAYQLDMTKKVIGKDYWRRKQNVTEANILQLRNELQHIQSQEISRGKSDTADEGDITIGGEYD